ncbi:penicillin-binding protein 1B [Algibacillus agarilyticus]|uniref:penicillin-binding protein 1B n=1 Tax=Algibacillus agarilyticus TaxID=2234133 RepID=UPI000DCF6C60|nr:penicillin-binding protein 1B [Algibacillus agarilyticus]
MTTKKTANFVQRWLVVQKWLVKTSIKLSFLLICALVFWGGYLDVQIEKKFGGMKWQLPIQVVGQATLFSKGDAVSSLQIKQYLDQLDYRSVAQVLNPGEYEISAGQITLYRRQFQYALPQSQHEYSVHPQHIRITLNDDRITHLFDLTTSQQIGSFRLEPFVIDRIQTHSLEDREFVRLSQLPELLKDTLLLVEDRGFYEHYGVSPIAIGRALYHNIKAGRTVQGGSTLTQQLVKNMFLTNERSLWRKIREAYIAVLLDAQYSKAEILEAYINEVYLGQNNARGVHGFALASRFYFGKQVAELAPNEIAMLVAIVKGPSYYNPRRYTERTLERRDLVLRLMTENNLISRDEYEHNIIKPLNTTDQDKLSAGRYTHYMTLVKQELKQLLTQLPSKKRLSGLKIYTHFDPVKQSNAQRALTHKINDLENDRTLQNLQGAIVVVNSKTGGVNALVGDKNIHYSGFNRALNAKRNIGSLIKPAIYLTALQQPKEYSLASMIEDKAITLASNAGKRWSPENYDHKFLGHVMLLDALVTSRNVPAVNIGMKLGIDQVTAQLQTLGVKSAIPQYPSMLLGSVTLSPYEVAQLYQPIANMGFKNNLHTIIGIYDQKQSVVAPKRATKQAIDQGSAYLLNYALQEVTRHGSARWLSQQFKQTRFAGKTGTTNDTRDSWFVGYDQAELAVVWLGHDDNASTSLTGSSGALRVFTEYQKQRSPVSLVIAKPQAVSMGYFSLSSGQPVEADCDNTRMLPVITTQNNSIFECDEIQLPDMPLKNESWFKQLFEW